MPNENESHLGQLLAQAIKDKGVRQVDVAREFGVKQSTVSSDWIKHGRIGKRHYPRLVVYFGKPYPWWFGGESPDTTTGSSEGSRAANEKQGYGVIRVDRLAARGSMGRGQELADTDHVVERLTLTADWVRQTLPRISNEHSLRVISAYGDSMMPTFNDGDLLLVDAGIHAVDIDGVYVLRTNARLYIKRVRQRLDGTFEVRSDNQLVGTPEELSGKQKVDVLGRVVWAWNGKKL